MPLYEYECESCHHRFERIQKYSDPPVDVCPVCGKGPVRKLVSSPAIQFKGSGWYITDYAKKNQPGSAAPKSEKTESGSSTSESKPSSDTAASSSPAAPSDSTKK